MRARARSHLGRGSKTREKTSTLNRRFLTTLLLPAPGGLSAKQQSIEQKAFPQIDFCPILQLNRTKLNKSVFPNIILSNYTFEQEVD